MAGALPDQMLADYEAVQARKNGLAVVALVEHRCTGCHVRLPENKVAAGGARGMGDAAAAAGAFYARSSS